MTLRMPLARPSRAGLLRATGVVLITGLVTIAAACSNEDTVDTIPPPWPSATNHSLDEGPRIPTSTGTSSPSTSTGTSTSTSTSVPRSGIPRPTGPGTTSSPR